MLYFYSNWIACCQNTLWPYTLESSGHRTSSLSPPAPSPTSQTVMCLSGSKQILKLLKQLFQFAFIYCLNFCLSLKCYYTIHPIAMKHWLVVVHFPERKFLRVGERMVWGCFVFPINLRIELDYFKER